MRLCVRSSFRRGCLVSAINLWHSGTLATQESLSGERYAPGYWDMKQMELKEALKKPLNL